MPTRRRKSPAAPAAPAKKPATRGWIPPTDVYEIEVTLRETRPPVWRRILVQGNLTLARLHAVLQVAMGWQESHLHVFHVGGKNYSDPEFGMDDDWGMDAADEYSISMAKAFKSRKARVVYEYDFGDSWEHDLRLVRVYPPKEAPAFGPVCVAGARACPPEDVGGTPGYEEFLQAIADPEHPENESYLEWAGGKFDPGKFDIDEVNRELRRLR